MPSVSTERSRSCQPEMASAVSTHFSFLLLRSFSSLDLCAALDVLNEANQFDQTPKYSWSLFSEDGNAVLASNGLSMNVDSPMMPISRRDTVIVLGGKEYLSASTLPVLAWLRSVSRQGARIGAIGSALFTLTKAGVHLNGPVSAHWAYREAIAEHYPDLELKHNIFCIGEKSLTCAGGAATLDMMLQLIALTSDSRIANWVADRLVCSSFRTGQEDQGAAEFVHMRKRDSKLAKAIMVMQSSLEEPISAKEIAVSTGVSTRQLERIFKAHMATSPKAFYMQLRLEHARRLRHQTALPLIEIAIASGFQSQSHFSRLYRKQFGVSPLLDVGIHQKDDPLSDCNSSEGTKSVQFEPDHLARPSAE
jgi:transcriptional regulator GlxA family with amidase domain